jgi:hypothetical protein
MGLSGQRDAPAVLSPRERIPGTHWTGGWVGLRAGMDTEARGKGILQIYIKFLTEENKSFIYFFINFSDH